MRSKADGLVSRLVALCVAGRKTSYENGVEWLSDGSLVGLKLSGVFTCSGDSWSMLCVFHHVFFVQIGGWYLGHLERRLSGFGCSACLFLQTRGHCVAIMFCFVVWYVSGFVSGFVAIGSVLFAFFSDGFASLVILTFLHVFCLLCGRLRSSWEVFLSQGFLGCIMASYASFHSNLIRKVGALLNTWPRLTWLGGGARRCLGLDNLWMYPVFCCLEASRTEMSWSLDRCLMS